MGKFDSVCADNSLMIKRVESFLNFILGLGLGLGSERQAGCQSRISRYFNGHEGGVDSCSG